MFKGLKEYTSTVRTKLTEEGPLLLRLLAASMIANGLIRIAFPGTADMTGTLTALLVVQSSVSNTFKTSMQKILSVITGVGLAVLLTHYITDDSLALFIAIGVSLLLGVMIDFGDNKLEVPISAMLIIAASKAGVAADQRIVNSIIGALTGLTVTLLFPMKPKLDSAIEAVSTIAFETAEATEELAESLIEHTGPITYVFEPPPIKAAEESVLEARDSLLWNIAPGKEVKEHKLDLMAAVKTLEESYTSIQKILLTLNLQRGLTAAAEGEELYKTLKYVYSTLLNNLSVAIRTYGELLRDNNSNDKVNEEKMEKVYSKLDASKNILLELFLLPTIPEEVTLTLKTTLQELEELEAKLNINKLPEYQVKTTEAVLAKVNGLPGQSNREALKRTPPGKLIVKYRGRQRRLKKLKK